ncbi:MAG: DUF3540 domain-containing protein [Alcaligenaceae bacterium]|nr:DUF3540 domain-containing protein [Alcaligenaceae bacterium]
MKKSLSCIDDLPVRGEQFTTHSSDLQELILEKDKRNQNQVDKLTHEQGVIIEIAPDGEYVIQLKKDGYLFKAKKAFSCIVEPELSDLVLVSGESAEYYILSILHRQKRDIKIEVPGKLELVATEASINVSSSISITAATADVTTQQWKQRAHQYVLNSYGFKHASSSFKYVGQTAETQLQNYHLLAADSQRYITGTDRVNALKIDYSADFISKLSAQTTLINGTEILKTDAKKILMG